MKPDPACFFITKIAKDDPDKLIDPGEAAAAGLAFASGAIANKVLPWAAAIAAYKFGPESKAWESLSQYGLKRFDLDELIKDVESPKLKRPILNLMKFKRAVPMTEMAPGEFIPFRSSDIRNFQTIAPTVNKMIDKYNLPKKGVRIDLGAGAIGSTLGASYDVIKKRLFLPDVQKDVVLHELGHAAHLTKPGASAIDTVKGFINKGLLYAIPMSYLAGNEIKKMIPGKFDDKAISFIQDHAPAIAASSIAATDIYPEIQATVRAVSHVNKTEGAKAAKQTLKNLLPAFASYVLPLVPITIGLSMARKYYKEAEKDHVKTARVLGDIASVGWGHFIAPIGREIAYLSKQFGDELGRIVSTDKVEDVAREFWKAGKKTIKSPEFIGGAALGGIPAAALAYVKYNMPHGKIYEEKLRTMASKESKIKAAKMDLERITDKEKEDRLTVPIIAGVSAALSGGILSKFFSDLKQVL